MSLFSTDLDGRDTRDGGAAGCAASIKGRNLRVAWSTCSLPSSAALKGALWTGIAAKEYCRGLCAISGPHPSRHAATEDADREGVKHQTRGLGPRPRLQAQATGPAPRPRHQAEAPGPGPRPRPQVPGPRPRFRPQALPPGPGPRPRPQAQAWGSAWCRQRQSRVGICFTTILNKRLI